MQKHLLNVVALLALTTALTQPSAQAQVNPTDQPAAVRTDNEYDRYRLRGDDLFKNGRYEEARRQYRNCLEVPGFENDTYASQRINLTTNCLALLQKADQAVQQQQPAEMVNRLTDLLVLNPVDPLVNNRLADHYLSEGNQLFERGRYAEATGQYQRGKVFAQSAGNRTTLSTLDLQIRNSDTRLNPPIQVYTPKRAGLKVMVGVLALGSGYYAYVLQNDFTTKKDAFTAVASATDPDDNGIIDTPDAYQRYNTAYTDMETAQKKRSLYVACLSVAAAATITELYLLLKKAKPRPVSGLHWKPSSAGYGLAIGYRF